METAVSLSMEAHRRLRSAWRCWPDQSDEMLNVLSFLKAAPDILIKNLGYTLEEPPFIPIGDIKAVSHRQNCGVFGQVDNEAKKILVVRSREELSRCTKAHEIGHVILHPDIKIHRDQPLNGTERSAENRGEKELEADIFAAALLMPERAVIKAFHARFRMQIDGRAVSKQLTDAISIMRYSLVSQSNVPVRVADFFQNGPGFRSLIAATATSFERAFPSLADAFAVTPTAMAIRLRELDLVL